MAPACTFFDSRPHNLRGSVACFPIEHEAHQELFVKVTLDEAAIQSHSQLDIIREVVFTESSTTEIPRLVVDIGQATGNVSTCGTFTDQAYDVVITDQMISYPSWIRIRSRSHDSVHLVIQDMKGEDVVNPRLLEPKDFRYTVQWLR